MTVPDEKPALVREEGARHGRELARVALAKTELESDTAIGTVVVSLREAAERLAAEPDMGGQQDLPAAWLAGALDGVETEVRAHFEAKQLGRLRHGA